MKKIAVPLICLAAFLGCRTHPVTPDESWSDFGHYYAPTGETAVEPTGALDFRIVDSRRVEAHMINLNAQGYVVLGCFNIADGTDITESAVRALAQKLNAGAVIWSSMTTALQPGSAPSPETQIVGTDITQSVAMNARRPDETFSEQTMYKHVIYMLGKKK